MGVMPEGFPARYIGDVHLHHGRLHGLHGVPDPYGGMGIGRGIQNDAVIGKADLLDFVDQFPLDIGLEIISCTSVNWNCNWLK